MAIEATAGDGQMRGSARVVAVEGDWLWLEQEPQSACHGCAARAGCGVSAVSAKLGYRADRLRLRNTIEAEVGERLVLGIETAQVLQASLRVYALPLVGLVAGAIAGLALGGETASMVVGLIGFGAGIARVWWLMRPDGGQEQLQPVILGRLPAEPEASCPS